MSKDNRTLKVHGCGDCPLLAKTDHGHRFCLLDGPDFPRIDVVLFMHHPPKTCRLRYGPAKISLVTT